MFCKIVSDLVRRINVSERVRLIRENLTAKKSSQMATAGSYIIGYSRTGIAIQDEISSFFLKTIWGDKRGIPCWSSENGEIECLPKPKKQLGRLHNSRPSEDEGVYLRLVFDKKYGPIVNVYLEKDVLAAKGTGSAAPLYSYYFYELLPRDDDSGRLGVLMPVFLDSLDIILASDGEEISPSVNRLLYARITVRSREVADGVIHINHLPTYNIDELKGSPRAYGLSHEMHKELLSVHRSHLGRELQLPVPSGIIQKHKIKNHSEVVICWERDSVNGKLLIKVYMRSDFEVKNKPEPILNYRYFSILSKKGASPSEKGVLKFVDLSALDIVETIFGNQGIVPRKGDGSKVVLKLLRRKNVDGTNDYVGTYHCNFLAHYYGFDKKTLTFYLNASAIDAIERAGVLPEINTAEVAVDSDLGPYILGKVMLGGKEIKAFTYYFREGVSTIAEPTDLGRVATALWLNGDRNVEGELIQPRQFEYRFRRLSRGKGTYDSRLEIGYFNIQATIVRLPKRLRGRDLKFIPLIGEEIRIYDLKEWNIDSETSSFIVMKKVPGRNILVPKDEMSDFLDRSNRLKK